MGVGISASGGPRNEFNESAINATDNLLTVLSDGTKSDSVLIPGISGKHIEIHSIYVSSSQNSGSFELNEETSDDLKFKIYFKASNSFILTEAHIDLAADKDLKITCPANTFAIVTYHYRSV